MATQSVSVADHARRTARRVAALIAKADALLITAGAGMSVDCVSPDDPDLQQAQALFVGGSDRPARVRPPHRLDAAAPEVGGGVTVRKELGRAGSA